MIGDLIGEWIKGILIDGIMGNLSGLFNTVNTKVGEIASDVGSTPQDWNGGIFSMLQNLSETVIVPIAAAILALVMCYELIDMIVEKNNMHDFDSSMFFRWIFKSAFAILIVTNTWNIVMGVFDATQQVVNQSAGVIIGDTSIDFDTLLPDLESRLEAMDIGPLLGLWFQTLVVGLTMNILSICIFLVTYGRMIEIYAVTALGPIPLATLGNAEWRGMGQNYLKSLLALGFQAFLIMVVVGIYAVLIQQIGTADDISGAIWGCMGYTVYVTVPLDLTKVKSKVVFGLTKRQLICFGGALLVGVPLFFLIRGRVPTSAAALIMVFAMLPGFLLALYEKYGQPLEVVVRQIVECCFIQPKERPYQTNNAYTALVRQSQMEKEVNAIVQKAKERNERKSAGQAHPRRKERDSGRHPKV